MNTQTGEVVFFSEFDDISDERENQLEEIETNNIYVPIDGGDMTLYFSMLNMQKEGRGTLVIPVPLPSFCLFVSHQSYIISLVASRGSNSCARHILSGSFARILAQQGS